MSRNELIMTLKKRMAKKRSGHNTKQASPIPGFKCFSKSKADEKRKALQKKLDELTDVCSNHLNMIS